MTVLSLLLVVTAFAQRSDKATVVTFNAPVEIPGSNPQVLPAGSYMFKLVDSKSSPHIVQISNREESTVYSTVLAIPAYRDASTRDTVVTFQERGTARPQAIEKWFYPNDVNGEEFVYSPVVAQPQVAAVTPPSPVTTQSPAPATVAPPAQPAPAPAPTPEAERAAAPPPQAPQAPPAPETTPTPAAQPQTQQPETLPHTASNLPVLFLAGLLALGTGWTLRRLS